MKIKDINKVKVNERIFRDILNQKKISIRKLATMVPDCSERTIRLSLKRQWMYVGKLESIAKALDIDPQLLFGKDMEDIYKRVDRLDCSQNEKDELLGEWIKQLMESNTYERYLQYKSLAESGTVNYPDAYTAMILTRYGVKIQDYLNLDDMQSAKFILDLADAESKVIKQYFPNLPKLTGPLTGMSSADLPVYNAGNDISALMDYMNDAQNAESIRKLWYKLNPSSPVRKLLKKMDNNELIGLAYTFELEEEEDPTLTDEKLLTVNNPKIMQLLKEYHIQ